jgi:hypothetical protein
MNRNVEFLFGIVILFLMALVLWKFIEPVPVVERGTNLEQETEVFQEGDDVPSPEKPFAEEASIELNMLSKLRTHFPRVLFTEPEAVTFKWRLSTKEGLMNVSGQTMFATDLSFQDLHMGEQSSYFQLESSLDDFFMENSFNQSLENASDSPAVSSMGWRSSQTDGLVCVRDVVNNDSEYISYSISCGLLPALTIKTELPSEETPEQPIACTMDAKMCPDGSYVGRVGPRCEFASCPNEVAEENEVQYCGPRSTELGACISLYDPVCAAVQVECVTTPCNPVPQTFGNSCEACQNERVISYTEGACGE